MRNLTKTVLLGSVMIGAGFAAPAFAQEAEEATGRNDIIVTAQRVEQRLQDVPISITVLDQQTLTNNNVSNAKDLAAYTPGLSVNNRYGSDSTTFSIRGFTQDQRTFATVGTFFADVVALRGSGATFGGDGAGPGALFDLQNVQVLKGPQGTLFGRNVTGGAVLLVPRRPSDKFEGYLEGSAGDYDMRRVQGVINLPVMDSLRIRAGFDHQVRDGYLKNVGNFGDGKFGNKGMGNVNYWAARFSAVADLSDDVENYLVVSASKSKSNGVIPSIDECKPGVAQFIDRVPANAIPVGNMACAQKAREDAAGFWAVSNRLPDSASIAKQWQIINTTTWRVSDSLKIKNIMSYGEFRGITNMDLFGNYFIQTGVTPGTETPRQVTGFAFTHAEGTYGYTNAQSSFVEELQLQGSVGDDALTWQAGAYVELNDPLGFSGVQTANFSACPDIAALNCVGFTPGLSLGGGSYSLSSTKFSSYALYGQASYKLTDRLTLTAGIRHTWDKMKTDLINISPNYGTLTGTCTNLTHPEFGQVFPLSERFTHCRQKLSQSTKAPTWTINVDYKPIDAAMVYAKWSRGYRQGGLAFFGPDPLQPFDAEKVDTYEVGAKTSWRGSFPGFFNISGFYNDFTNQQLLLGISCDSNRPGYKGPCTGNAAVVNAAASTLKGFEADFGVTAFDILHLGASYGYLQTKLKEFVEPALPAGGPWNSVSSPLVSDAICPSVPKCNTIPNSIPHKVSLTASLDLPIGDSLGKLSVGGTWVYTSGYRIVFAGAPALHPRAGMVPGSRVLNLNASWENVGGLPVDLSAFVTNVTNEHVYLQANDNLASRGFISYIVGEPRMWGARLRYKFGQ